jgi:hypothetical protein
MANGPIIKDSLYLMVSSIAGQANNGAFTYGANRGGIYAVDNISRSGNTTNYTSFSIGPTWRPKIGSYVNGTVSSTFYHTSSGNISNGPNSSAIQSDSVTGYANLTSGKEFGLFGWRFNARYYDNIGNNTNNSLYSNSPMSLNYNGQVQYKVSETLQPYIQGGTFQNSYGNNNSVAGARNGSYWNAGIIWTPSRRLYLQGGVGPSNYMFSLRSTPTKRTELAVMYRDSNVGGATGYGGSSYGAYGGSGGMGGLGGSSTGGGIYKAGMRGACSANLAGGSSGANMGSLGMGGMGGIGGVGGVGGMSGIGGIGGFGGAGGLGGGFNYTGGAVNTLGNFNSGSTVTAGLCHTVRRTSFKAAYNEFTTTTPLILNSNPVFDQNNNPYGIPYNQANLTNPNEVITLKGGQAIASHTYKKSTYSLSVYQQDRNYQYSGSQSVFGLTASWSSNFARNTRGFLAFSWQSQDNNPLSQPAYTSDMRLFQVGVYHTLWKNAYGGVSYRYINQDSKTNPYARYDVNTIFANITMSF